MKVDRNPAWIFNLKITHCLRLEITIALGKKRGAGPLQQTSKWQPVEKELRKSP
jgi:hypothetical protein